MRRAAALLAAVLTTSAVAPSTRAEEAAAEPSGPMFNIMGPSSCARWPRRASIDSAAKAVSLNWALGFLSGVAERSDDKMFELLQPEKVGAFIDGYCQDNPDASLPAAVRALERELTAQLPPPPPPMFYEPAPVAAVKPAETEPKPAAKAAPKPAPKRAAARKPAPRRPAATTAAKPAPAPALRR